LFRAMKSLSDCLSLRWNGSVVDDKDLGHPCKAKNRFNCRIQKKIELKLFHGYMFFWPDEYCVFLQQTSQ
jgi:hypothetical protein